jgi:hypothetical protein
VVRSIGGADVRPRRVDGGFPSTIRSNLPLRESLSGRVNVGVCIVCLFFDVTAAAIGVAGIIGVMLRGRRYRPICHRGVRVALGRAWDGGRSRGQAALAGTRMLSNMIMNRVSRREFAGRCRA